MKVLNDVASHLAGESPGLRFCERVSCRRSRAVLYRQETKVPHVMRMNLIVGRKYKERKSDVAENQ